MIEIRDIDEDDLLLILQWNEDAVPAVNSLDIDTLRRILRIASYRRLAEIDAVPAGFLLILGSDAPYWSANFRWFQEHYDAFLYIDRVVVAGDARRRGVAGALYDDAMAWATTRAPLLACEVNIVPSNRISQRFHKERGFDSVGTRGPDEEGKSVSMLIRRTR